MHRIGSRDCTAFMPKNLFIPNFCFVSMVLKNSDFQKVKRLSGRMA